MADDFLPDDSTAPNLADLANAQQANLRNRFGLGTYMDWVINNYLKGLMAAKGMSLRLGKTVLEKIAIVGKEIFESADAVVGPLAATIVAIMFGGNIGEVLAKATATNGDITAGAEQVGAAVLDAVFGPLNLGGGQELQPGMERADAYLGTIAAMIMRGFVLDIAADCVPEWHLEFIKDLEEMLISGLGLGRIARRVLQPIVTTLVADPAQWAINLAYRPKLHDVAHALRLWEVGELDDAALDDELGRQGWSSARIEQLKAVTLKPADFAAMTVLRDHGVHTDDDVVVALRSEGFTEGAALAKLAAHKLARLDPWLTKQAELWLSKYENGLIEHDVFVASLRTTGLPDDLLQLLANIGGAAREVPRKLLSSSELFTAWKNNILTQNQVHDGLLRLGYSDDDTTTLLLTQLAVGMHASEVAQAKTAAAAARAAAVAQTRAEKLAAQQQARLDAAAAKAAREKQIAAAKAQAAQDAETRREFIAAAAAQRRALVDQASAAASIDKDHAAALKAQIDADERALLAAATTSEAEANVTFEKELLDLQTSAREADLEQQLADVDLALEEATAARADAVAVRLATVDQLATMRLQDLETLYAQREQTLAEDLAASLDAVDVAMLPTTTERNVAATEKMAQLDAELQRKLADVADEYASKHASVDDELARGLVTDKAAQRDHDRLTLAQQQAERLATQQHDLSVQRLTNVAAAADALSVATATKQKTMLQAAHAKAAKKLAADKLAGELAARQSADAERVRLHAIAAQSGPLSAAAADTKRRTIHAQLTRLQASQAAQATVIAKAEASAAAIGAKAQTAVDAAKARLALLEQTAGAREAAAAAATLALETFDAKVAADRDALEATIMQHRVGPTSGSVPP